MLTGKKIFLEKPQLHDAATLQSWYLDKAFRYLYDGYSGNSMDMILDEIRQAKDITDPSAKRVEFIVKSNRTRQPIGVASINNIDRQNGNAAIMLGIYDKNKRLAGFGVDLMIVLCDIVFYEFGFERCYLQVADGNELGLRSALSFGFTAEGKLRHQLFIEGKYQDQWVLGLLRGEYEDLSIVSRWKARG